MISLIVDLNENLNVFKNPSLRLYLQMQLLMLLMKSVLQMRNFYLKIWSSRFCLVQDEMLEENISELQLHLEHSFFEIFLQCYRSLQLISLLQGLSSWICGSLRTPCVKVFSFSLLLVLLLKTFMDLKVLKRLKFKSWNLYFYEFFFYVC